MTEVSPKEAIEEVLARRKAQESLPHWVDYVQPGLTFAAHHVLLMRELEKVERGEVQNLLVQMPPGSAKSSYTSVWFPPWVMGRNPDWSVIAASHTSELAERFGRRVRNIVGGREFRNVFSFGLADDSAAAGRWDTERGGEYYATGVGGSVTGRRGDLVIIDDPVRSREDADSDRIRESTWQWYVNDLLTRLKPGGRQILVMTRWHEDDLGGRILEREADQWRVIRIPMEAGPGDPIGRAPGERLWPDWFTEKMVEVAKRDPRGWNALYQQEPAPDSGDYFKKEWFQWYTKRPDVLRVYGASDLAVTEGGGDYTEHGVFGLDAHGDIYVLDWWRGQSNADEWIRQMLRLMVRHQPLAWFGESGPIRRAVEPFLKQRMTDGNVWCRLEWMASIADKAARARSIQAMAASGKVYLPKGAGWASDVLGQLLRFPAGKHDDAVDAFSLIGRGLELIQRPREEQRVVMTPWVPADPAMGY